MPSPDRLRPGHVIRARGDSWIVQRHIAGAHGAILEVRGRGVGNRGTRASFLLPFESIEHLPSSETPRRVGARSWRRAARAILASATPSYDALRSPARATLAILPFQLEPVLALVRGHTARLLIADEVGLGKTIQAGLIISELLERRPDARVLVVTPAGLRDQWQSELRDRFGRDSMLLDSSSISRHTLQWNGNPWSIPGIVLTSLDYVKRPEVVRALESLIWDVLVLDEAHTLAGRSDRATVAALLARRARTLILLTATPHSGDENAFRRLTALGDFSNRFPLLVFRRTRRDVGIAAARRTLTLRVRLTRHEAEMHTALMAYARQVWSTGSSPAARLAMAVLTRRACSSAWSLARSIETRLRLLTANDGSAVLQLSLPFAEAGADDGAPGMELSAPGLSDRDEERSQLEHLLSLARAAESNQSKLLALRRLLRRSAEPAIVFTEYRDTLHQLAHHLQDFAPVLLHGGMNGHERQQALRQFADADSRLLLATDAASEGLNLHQRCRLVINLELPWTAVRLEQRIGRVERLGQTKRVHAVHLLAAGTCEQDSVAVLVARMRRVADVLGGMRATACEEQVATAALGTNQDKEALEEDLADFIRDRQSPLPPGIAIGNLRASAIEEAARLEQVRVLRPSVDIDLCRPCVTVFARRGANPANDWAFRLVFEDSELQPLWTTVIGLRDGANLLRPSNAAIRERIAAVTAEEPVLPTIQQRLLASFRSAIETPRSLAIRREQSIEEGLRQQRARLASSLLQPGLFDRRVERAVAAQNATLDDALERCRQYLTAFTRLDPVSIDARLAFGVVRK